MSIVTILLTVCFVCRRQPRVWLRGRLLLRRHERLARAWLPRQAQRLHRRKRLRPVWWGTPDNLRLCVSQPGFSAFCFQTMLFDSHAQGL